MSQQEKPPTRPDVIIVDLNGVLATPVKHKNCQPNNNRYFGYGPPGDLEIRPGAEAFLGQLVEMGWRPIMVTHESESTVRRFFYNQPRILEHFGWVDPTFNPRIIQDKFSPHIEEHWVFCDRNYGTSLPQHIQTLDFMRLVPKYDLSKYPRLFGGPILVDDIWGVDGPDNYAGLMELMNNLDNDGSYSLDDPRVQSGLLPWRKLAHHPDYGFRMIDPRDQHGDVTPTDWVQRTLDAIGTPQSRF